MTKPNRVRVTTGNLGTVYLTGVNVSRILEDQALVEFKLRSHIAGQQIDLTIRDKWVANAIRNEKLAVAQSRNSARLVQPEVALALKKEVHRLRSLLEQHGIEHHVR
jgi:hypothetical protein